MLNGNKLHSSVKKKSVQKSYTWILARSHPHSTYAQRGGEGRGQAKCVGLRTRGERGFQGCVRAQKNFLDQLFFFCTKETITLPFIIAYRKV